MLFENSFPNRKLLHLSLTQSQLLHCLGPETALGFTSRAVLAAFSWQLQKNTIWEIVAIESSFCFSRALLRVEGEGYTVRLEGAQVLAGDCGGDVLELQTEGVFLSFFLNSFSRQKNVVQNRGVKVKTPLQKNILQPGIREPNIPFR